MQPAAERQGARKDSAPAAQLPDGFGVLFCPVTGLILRRDPPAAAAMVVVGVSELIGAPRDPTLCCQKCDTD